MNLLSRLLLTVCLAAPSINYGYCCESEDDDLSGMIGGAQPEKKLSYITYLHGLVPTKGQNISNRDSLKMVFEEPVTLTVPVMTPNAVLTCTFSYNPQEVAPPFSRSISSVESNGGLFDVFLEDFQKSLLADQSVLQTKDIETQLTRLRLKQSMLTEKMKHLKVSDPHIYLKVYNDLGGDELEKQLLDLIELPSRIEKYLTTKVLEGFAPFTRVYAVPTHPQKLYNDGKHDRQRREKRGVKVVDRPLVLSVHFSTIETGMTEDTQSTMEASNSMQAGQDVVSQINNLQRTCSQRFDSNQNVKELFDLWEEDITHKLESSYMAIMQYYAQPDDNATSMFK